jgi:hypothetical protein
MIWIVFTLLVISIYVNINLFRKVEGLEEANEESNVWVENYGLSLKNILTKIRALDSKNIFESDDEVGTTFDAIRKTIESLEELNNNAKEK